MHNYISRNKIGLTVSNFRNTEVETRGNSRGFRFDGRRDGTHSSRPYRHDFVVTKAVIISLTFRLQWVSIRFPRSVARIKRALPPRRRWEPLRRRATFWVALVSRRDYGRRIYVLTCAHVRISTYGWCTSTRLRAYTYVGGAPFYTRRAYITRDISSAHSCSIPLRDQHTATRRYSPWSRDGIHACTDTSAHESLVEKYIPPRWK